MIWESFEDTLWCEPKGLPGMISTFYNDDYDPDNPWNLPEFQMPGGGIYRGLS
jgi:hypothetical protein